MLRLSLRPSTSKTTHPAVLATALAALSFLFTGFSFAQTDQGSITGIIQDSSGAVIPNAQVTVTNVDTGLALAAKSNRSGVFVFSPLKIGNYTLSAQTPFVLH